MQQFFIWVGRSETRAFNGPQSIKITVWHSKKTFIMFLKTPDFSLERNESRL